MGGPLIPIGALVALFVWVMGLLAGVVVLLRKTFWPKGDQSRLSGTPFLILLWGIWILVALVLGVFLFLLLPVSSVGREAPLRITCVNNLRQIGLALHNYHDEHGCFPPAYTADERGQRLHSWRTLLLPYLEHEGLYDQLRLDEPWDSPHNRATIEEWDAPSVFRCPSAHDDPPATCYVMIVGPETFSSGPSGRSIKDITDGTSNTITVVETEGSGIHWAEPRDLDSRTLNFQSDEPAEYGIRSNHPQVVNAAFADGSVHSIDKEIDPQLFKALLTVAGGEDVSTFREKH
jgi:prepilin-type processing-associated H-X9-DG protein